MRRINVSVGAWLRHAAVDSPARPASARSSVAGRVAAARVPGLALLEDLDEAVASLQLAYKPLGAQPVPVHPRVRAVVALKRDDDEDVVVPGRRLAVVDSRHRHGPPGRRRSSCRL